MGFLEAIASKTINVAQPGKKASAKESTYSHTVAQYAEAVVVGDSKELS